MVLHPDIEDLSREVHNFTSYLSGRQQKTYVNSTLSNSLPIACGVPQGSILGPLLFLIYINDLQMCTSSSTTKMYADDTCLFASTQDPSILQNNLNEGLKKVLSWLHVHANKLTLNIKKTKHRIIASHYNLNHMEHDFEININEIPLKRVKSYRYLGLEIDETLSWHVQVDAITKKVSAGLGALKRIRDLVPTSTLQMMYEALILPYLDYCSEVWGCMGKCLADRIQKLQNRAARIITYSNYDIRSADILEDLGWDTLERRRSKQLAVSVYKAKNNFSSKDLKNLFRPITNVHSYKLRNNLNNLFVHRPRKEAGKCSFNYRGTVLWNGLSNEIKAEPSIASFKGAL